MGSLTCIKFNCNAFLIRSDTHQIPTQTPGDNLSIDEGKYIDTLLLNGTVSGTEYENVNQSDKESFQLDTAEALQKLREQIIFAKRTQQRVRTQLIDKMLYVHCYVK